MATTKQQTKKEEKYNEGNLAEGVLGAAIVAKIILRQPNGKIGRLTAVDVKKVLQQICKVPNLSKGGKKTRVKLDSGGTAKDRIIFYLNLGLVTTTALQKMKDFSQITRLCDAAASYANSVRIEAFAESMYNNQIDNKIEIDVDGISDNKGTKTDIAVWSDKHVFDKISLKAGQIKTGHTLGQIGGNTWASILRLFHKGANPDTGKKEAGLGLPINTSANEDRYMKLVTEKPNFQTVEAALRWVYPLASDAINKTPHSILAHNVCEFLRFHATRDDTDVKIVMLYLDKHKTLDPLLLEAALRKVKLKSVARMDTRWPIILVYDADIGNVPTTKHGSNVLFCIRPKIDSRSPGYISHLVIDGPRFSAMLDYDVWYSGTEKS